MAFGIITCLLLLPPSTASTAPSFLAALGMIQKTQTGFQLLEKAASTFNARSLSELATNFQWGERSKTDAVLTRHLDPQTGQETRTREITISIRTSEQLENIALDMAHELVHATSSPEWDPYDPKLTPGKYIWTSIEGPGGEVDAVYVECQIASELHHDKRCEEYRDSATGLISQEQIRISFYRVGEWKEDFEKHMKSELSLFPLLSNRPPRLYSSTGNAPYPVSLFREYKLLNEIACENSLKRVQAVRHQVDPHQRKLASEKALLASRCRQWSIE